MPDNTLKIRQQIEAIAAFKRTSASVALKGKAAIVFRIGNTIGWCYITNVPAIGMAVRDGIEIIVLFVWPQPSDMTADVLRAIMHDGHFQIVGKLSQMEVTDLSAGEISRAFDGVGRRQYCDDIATELIGWGLTHSMLNDLCTPSE